MFGANRDVAVVLEFLLPNFVEGVSLVKRLTFLTASAVFLAAVMGLSAARADDVKPVAVVSLSGYDNVMSDVELIGELSGNPHLGKVVEGLVVVATKGEGLAGLTRVALGACWSAPTENMWADVRSFPSPTSTS